MKKVAFSVLIWDESGRPFAALFYRNGAQDPVKYYYVTNLQGDVIQIRDNACDEYANYTYNAWGELMSVTDEYGNPITDPTDFAIINPIRYRGYYYDAETGFYYLNSRYYDPSICRFINSFNGMNLFAYCNNNPVMFSDPSGNITEWDRRHLTESELSMLSLITKRWNDSYYCSFMQLSYHSDANKIRAKHMMPYEIVDSSGNVYVDEFALQQYILSAQTRYGNDIFIYLTTGAAVAQFDSPIPGPADLIGGIIVIFGMCKKMFI